MSAVLSRLAVGFLALIAVLILFAWFVLLRPIAQPATNDPLQVFDHGSIGNETAQGLPYWIWRVLPTMFPEYLPGNKDGYASIGVYWIAGEELPVGFSKKTIGFERVGITCALCHSGRLHAPGEPMPRIVLGAPGNVVDVLGYYN